MYIAYAYSKSGRELRSDDAVSRYDAATELLRLYPAVKSVSTCKSLDGNPTGQDIRPHYRYEFHAITG
jgi:hypothetical protein